MLTIDEAIAREKQLAEVWSEEHEQIAKWLEEFKTLKENSISKEAFEKMKSKSYQYGYRKGHSNAIDECIEVFRNIPRHYYLDEFLNELEQLKEQNNDK